MIDLAYDTGWLEDWIAERSSGELRATVRLLHRAIASRGQLGWMARSEEPAIVAALCLALTAELRRRGEATMVCGPCAATVAASRGGWS